MAKSSPGDRVANHAKELSLKIYKKCAFNPIIWCAVL